ncbi:MAG: insulinase family protein, partial [Nanoarchaeota archaeon]|nr:insulinase family protein [Nanoarchaeota archaeon]
ELNAYTSNERTCFYVKVPKKHFSKAMDIISDIIQHPLFDQKKIDKERKIILKEINLHKDEPRFHQWVLFQKALFKEHPARYPTYGSVKAVSTMTRKDLLGYYSKFYRPDNMILSVVGEVTGIEKHASRFSFKRPNSVIQNIDEETKQIKTEVKEKKNILNSYMILGYKTPLRINKDSYVFDVIKSILGKGQSGRLFEEIRNKRGLAYEVGAYHEPASSYGYFAVYVNTAKNKIKLCTRLILEEFRKLKNVSKKELDEALGFIEGKFLLDNEDTHEWADELGFWSSINDARMAEKYLDEIRKVTVKDIARVAEKYLTSEYTLAIIG